MTGERVESNTEQQRRQEAEDLWNRASECLREYRSEEAHALLQEFVHRFDSDPEPRLRERVATALVEQGTLWLDDNQLDRAWEFFAEVERRYAGATEGRLKARAVDIHLRLGEALWRWRNLEGASACYEWGVHLYAEAPEPEVRKRVAECRLRVWGLLEARGQSEAARPWFDAVPRGLGDTSSPPGRQWLIEVFEASFLVLTGMGSGVALRCVEELLRRYGEARERGVAEAVVRAYFLRSSLLRSEDRWCEALVDWREAMRRNEALGGPVDATERLETLELMGLFLHRQGHLEEARSCFEEVLATREPWPERWETAAPRALRELGELAEEQGCPEEALAHYTECVRRFGLERGLPRDFDVLQAHFRLAGLHLRAGRFDKARACLREMMLRYGSAPEPWMRREAVRAHRSVAEAFFLEDRLPEMEACLLELVRRHEHSEDPEVRLLVSQVLHELGAHFSSFERLEPALECLEKALGRCDRESDPTTRELGAGVHQRLAICLWKARPEQARTHFEACIRQLESLSPPKDPLALPYTLRLWGQFLLEQRDFEASWQRLREVVDRFGDSPHPDIRSQAARALGLCAELLGTQEQLEPCFAVVEDMERRFARSTDVSVRHDLAEGRLYAAALRVREAKRAWERGEHEVLREGLLRARHTLEPERGEPSCTDAIRALLVYITFLQGERQQARTEALEGLQQRGEGLRQALEGVVQPPLLFLDEAWRKLVNALPPGD